MARKRELPVPPQPRRSGGVLARSDDNLAGRYPVDIVEILCRYYRLYRIDLWTYRIGSNIVGHNL